jgi:hypothetical protein
MSTGAHRKPPAKDRRPPMWRLWGGRLIHTASRVLPVLPVILLLSGLVLAWPYIHHSEYLFASWHAWRTFLATSGLTVLWIADGAAFVWLALAHNHDTPCQWCIRRQFQRTPEDAWRRRRSLRLRHILVNAIAETVEEFRSLPLPWTVVLTLALLLLPEPFALVGVTCAVFVLGLAAVVLELRHRDVCAYCPECGDGEWHDEPSVSIAHDNSIDTPPDA